MERQGAQTLERKEVVNEVPKKKRGKANEGLENGGRGSALSLGRKEIRRNDIEKGEGGGGSKGKVKRGKLGTPARARKAEHLSGRRATILL